MGLGASTDYFSLLRSDIYTPAHRKLNYSTVTRPLAATKLPEKLQTLIRTPVISDTVALARIHVAAFKKSRLLRLMYDEANHWKAVNTMVERRINHVDYGMKMALSESKDHILGWLYYNLVNTNTPAKDNLASFEWITAALHVVENAEERLTKTSGRPEEAIERHRRQALWKAISRASAEAFSKSPATMRQGRIIIINTIVTDVAFQKRGVGTALLSVATNYADNEKIAVWAQVSPVPYGLFVRAGFEEVHSFVMDLDDFSRDGIAKKKGSKARFGDYEIKFMMRKARD